jgi:hypothetical protein
MATMATAAVPMLRLCHAYASNNGQRDSRCEAKFLDRETHDQSSTLPPVHLINISTERFQFPLTKSHNGKEGSSHLPWHNLAMPENAEKRQPKRLQPYACKKGQSGNPAGRTKGKSENRDGSRLVPMRPKNL